MANNIKFKVDVPSWLKTLRFVRSHRVVAQREVVKDSRNNQGYVCDCINQAVAKGLMIKHINPKNKRTYIVEITQKGIDIVDKYCEL